MIRILLLLFIVYVVLVISALADCLGGELSPHHLPRSAWALVILVVPVVGAILWFTNGHPRAVVKAGPVAPPPKPRTGLAPDDDPAFLAELAKRLKKKEGEEK